MKIQINGNEKLLEKSLTVLELLKTENVKMPDMVSVELNDKILKRQEFDSTNIKDGDRVEFLYFMGGGR
jgi:sulfur carrier protein